MKGCLFFLNTLWNCSSSSVAHTRTQTRTDDPDTDAGHRTRKPSPIHEWLWRWPETPTSPLLPPHLGRRGVYYASRRWQQRMTTDSTTGLFVVVCVCRVADPTGDWDRIIFIYIHADTPFLSHTLLRLVGHVGGSGDGPLWGHVYTHHCVNFGKGRGGDGRLTRISLWIFLGGISLDLDSPFGGTGDRKTKRREEENKTGGARQRVYKALRFAFRVLPLFSWS